MASALPSRLLSHEHGRFFVIDPRMHGVNQFDIVSHTWGQPTEQPYDCGIQGLNWNVTISPGKLEDIKKLMVTAGIQYLWVDCLCINQDDAKEKATEMSRMYEYYSSARVCHILIAMDKVWNPQDIVNNLKHLDHILYHMGGSALATEAPGLTQNSIDFLSTWATQEWTFDLDERVVRAAAIDLGVLNCYSTCTRYVRSFFDNLYFSRVWTFQEMLLGKNITMWAINSSAISRIGALHTWMDLAIDSDDRAKKLQLWITNARVSRSASVEAVLGLISDDISLLDGLQMQVLGIGSARSDIINGGPSWWRENYRGISNIFSAISIMPRECKMKEDIFWGLLGVFSGLFTPEEIEKERFGQDMDRISFAFFKQLSIKTGFAWTKLSISSTARGEWDWIPALGTHGEIMSTDCFAGVVNLGVLKKEGRAEAAAMTGIDGVPYKYMKIRLARENRGFQFTFRGCNCGKEVKTGFWKSELIPTNDPPRDVVKDETGRILVQCATILGSIFDPKQDLVEYRQRLLRKLQPHWRYSDPNARPPGWIDRCVSGTFWEDPKPGFLKVHNMSMNYRMVDVYSCESRLDNASTASISCEARASCGCTITAPFAFMIEAITAVKGSFLGKTTASLDPDNRIILTDGLGLVQVGEVGKTIDLVAFQGDVNYHKSLAAACRKTKKNKAVWTKLSPPSSRALVSGDFTHTVMDNFRRTYGYVETGGAGNLLICKNNPVGGEYKIAGVCIDDSLRLKEGKGLDEVIIR